MSVRSARILGESASECTMVGDSLRLPRINISSPLPHFGVTLPSLKEVLEHVGPESQENPPLAPSSTFPSTYPSEQFKSNLYSRSDPTMSWPSEYTPQTSLHQSSFQLTTTFNPPFSGTFDLKNYHYSLEQRDFVLYSYQKGEKWKDIATQYEKIFNSKRELPNLQAMFYRTARNRDGKQGSGKEYSERLRSYTWADFETEEPSDSRTSI